MEQQAGADFSLRLLDKKQGPRSRNCRSCKSVWVLGEIIMKNTRIYFILILLILTTSCNKNHTKPTSENFPLQPMWEITRNSAVVDNLGINQIVIQSLSGIEVVDTFDGNINWANEHVASGEPGDTAVSVDLIASIQYERTVVLFNYQGEEINTFDLRPISGPNDAQIAAISSIHLFVIRSPDWILEVYDLISGAFLWETGVERGGSDVWVNEDGHEVYIETYSGMSARDENTGETNFDITGNIEASAYQRGIAYLYGRPTGSTIDQLFAVAMTGNTTLWSTAIAIEGQKSISIYQDMVLISSAQGVAAFHADLGDRIWQFAPEDVFIAPVVGIDDTLYARGAQEQIIYALSLNGENTGRLDLGSMSVLSDRTYKAPLFISSSTLIFTFGDTVYAYGSK